MATLREFIVSQSSLPAGNTIRDHIKNPYQCELILYTMVDSVEVELVSDCIEVELASDSIDVELDDGSVEVEIADDTIDVEVPTCG